VVDVDAGTGWRSEKRQQLKFTCETGAIFGEIRQEVDAGGGRRNKEWTDPKVR